jgi:hypothetical protein
MHSDPPDEKDKKLIERLEDVQINEENIIRKADYCSS